MCIAGEAGGAAEGRVPVRVLPGRQRDSGAVGGRGALPPGAWRVLRTCGPPAGRYRPFADLCPEGKASSN